jgi:hypothetical protein
MLNSRCPTRVGLERPFDDLLYLMSRPARIESEMSGGDSAKFQKPRREFSRLRRKAEDVRTNFSTHWAAHGC